MKEHLSTREAARKLGVAWITLERHCLAKTFEAPPVTRAFGVRVRLWSDRDIEIARQALAGIRPGRKKKAVGVVSE
jgi:hypothetical protein